MKTRTLFTLTGILLFLLFLQSCEPQISFEQPQPAGVGNENAFKKKFLGKYFCIDDSSYLYVFPTFIMQEWGTRFAYPKSVFDTIKTYSIRNDSIFGSEIERGVPFMFVNDTISFVLNYKDTIFQINSKNVLRYFKKQYFLNDKVEENMWFVRKMYIDKDGYLVFADLSSVDEIDNLKEVTDVKEIRADSSKVIIRYSANPTKKQFKEFVKKGGFTKVNRFVKVKH